MDLGLFFTTKRRLLYWIFLPVLGLVVFYLIFFNSLDSQKKALREREAFIELAPIMEQKVLMVEDMISNYKGASADTGVIEMLNLRMGKIAQTSNFSINSLAVEKGEAKSGIDLGVYKITLKGQGSLLSVIDFLKEVNLPRMLLAVESCNVSLDMSGKEPLYEAELVILYYNL